MDALGHARELISFPTVSKTSNANVTDHIERQLRGLNFAIERVDYVDGQGVNKANVVAKRGDGGGGLAFFGHTDVVPADDWSLADAGPFEPTVRDGKLFGRGSCDMKGPVACVLAALESCRQTSLKKPLYVAFTSDEEIGYTGAKELVAKSNLYREMVEHQTCGVITEPTTLDVVHGHKGTYGFMATSRGRAAHSSTREGLNANLAMIPFLVEMKAIHDEVENDPAWANDEFDPPTVSWNIGINDHTHAVNITPPQSICTVYFRPMPGQQPERLMQRAEKKAADCGIEFKGYRGCAPLYIDPNSDYVQSMVSVTGCERARTVSYGTDGGMFTELKNLVVLGPGDIAQAHTSDEWILLDQLHRGTEVYEHLIDHWCC